MKKSNTLLALFIVLFFLFTALQQFFLYKHTDVLVRNYEEAKFSGRASQAIVTLCIDRTTPFFNASTCPSSINQNSRYFCELNGTDPDGDTLTFSSANITGQRLFTITSNGVIDFTPNNSLVGFHSMNITIDDNTGCINSRYSELLNITVINVNDPPIFILNIPNQSIQNGETLYAFYLKNHFFDPDNDILLYEVLGGIQGINISIVNNPNASTYSQVVIRATACVEADVYFIATERYTLEQYSAISNLVHIQVSCTNPGTGSQDREGAGGGAGGTQRTCKPDWQCTKWGNCMPNGTQMRRCVDYNGCDPNNYIYYQYRPCEYPLPPACTERWDCTDWGVCLPNSTRMRVCTDLNRCGTFKDKPETSQNCTIEQPGNITQKIIPGQPDEFPWITYILVIAILLLAILITVYKLYKKQIREIVVRIGWYLTKRRRKSILLTDDAKEKLLKQISDAEKLIGKIEIEKSSSKLTSIAREYFMHVLKAEYEFSKEEFFKKLEQKKLDKIIEKIFKPFFELSYSIEFSKYKPMPYELLCFMDELRLIIFQTSNVTKKDVENIPKQRKTHSSRKIDHLFTMVSNAMIPVQFNESAIARKFYLQTLKEFNLLKLSEQEIVYPYLQRLYDEINYVSHLVATVKLT